MNKTFLKFLIILFLSFINSFFAIAQNKPHHKTKHVTIKHHNKTLKGKTTGNKSVGKEKTVEIANDTSKQVDSRLNAKTKHHIHHHKRKEYSLNIKSQPGFFWSSLGIEAEISIKQKYSAGINIIGKLASLDGIEQISKSRQDDYLQNGILIEGFFRYFLHEEDHHTFHSPTGFYIHSFIGASNIIYADGNIRPFCMHNQLESAKGNQIQTPSNINSPKPFYGGVGFGYQFIILPGHIIGNFLLATQANVNSNDKFMISFFVSPSVGWLF